MIALVAVLWAVYLTERCVRWKPGDWIFRRAPFASVSAVAHPDITFWNERLAVAWTTLWPGDLAFRAQGDRLDAGEYRARIDEVRRHTRWLRGCASALFLLLLVIFPGLVISERLSPSLPYLVTAVGVTWACTIVTFVRSFRRVHGARPTLEVWLTHVLSPVSLIGAPLTVALDAGSAAHPVAAAYVLCDDDEFLRVARLWHFDAVPLRTPIEALVAARGAAERLLESPRDVDAGLSTYCPRCHATFTAAAHSCADCRDVKLVLLAGRKFPVELSVRNDKSHDSDRHEGGRGGARRARHRPVLHSGARARDARRNHRRQAS